MLKIGQNWGKIANYPPPQCSTKIGTTDFNALFGTDTDTWKGVIGKHGVTGLNENGRYLLQLCCSNVLRIRNTFFQHREVHRYTWYRPSMDQKS